MKTTWDELMRYAPEKEYPLPALERGMSLHDAEIDAITSNNDEPTFENTILAYDNAGRRCSRRPSPRCCAARPSPLTQTAGSASTGCSERRPR